MIASVRLNRAARTPADADDPHRSLVSHGQPALVATSVLLVASMFGVIVGHDLSGLRRLVLLAVASASYLALIAWKRMRLTLVVVIACAVPMWTAAVVIDPHGTDLWAYQSYGRVITDLHANPYITPPAALRPDSVVDRMTYWTDSPSVYGPVLVGTSIVAGFVLGDHVLLIRLFWQLIEAAALATACLLIWRRTRNPAAIGFIALNPVAIYELIHLAHIDASIGLGVVGGALLLRSRRYELATCCLVAVGLIKAPLLLAAAAVVAWLVLSGRIARAIRCALVAAGTVSVAIWAAGGRVALRAMLDAADQNNAMTIWTPMRGGWKWVLGEPLVGTGLPHARGLSTAALVLGAGLAGWATWRTRRAESPDVAVGIALGGWLCLSLYTSAWSFGWLIPLVALAPVAVRVGAAALTSVFHLASQAALVSFVARYTGDQRLGLPERAGGPLLALTLIGLSAALVASLAWLHRCTDDSPVGDAVTRSG